VFNAEPQGLEGLLEESEDFEILKNCITTDNSFVGEGECIAEYS